MAAPLLLDDAQHRLVVSTCHPRSILAETAHVFPDRCTSAAIWKYLGTLAGLERRWLRRSSSTMHNIASSSRLAIPAQSSPRLLTYFQIAALAGAQRASSTDKKSPAYQKACGAFFSHRKVLAASCWVR